MVSKAEGRLVAIAADDPAAKVALVEQESVRILRRSGDLIISGPRTVLSAPMPASTCRMSPRVRRRCYRSIRIARHAGFEPAWPMRIGVDVGVIISDTFGRTWCRGVTDVAIGCAGVAR